MSPLTPTINRSNNDESDGMGATPINLGERIRSLRRAAGWSLDEASDRAGISRSSLFKIEKGKMSPTFDAMLKIAKGFQIDVSHLLRSPSGGVGVGRRSVTRAGEGARYDMPNYQHTLLSADFANKSFTPFRLVVRARSLEDFSDWDRHESEDFIYVLSGAVVIFTEFYEPLTLEQGDSIYYDGRMGHACTSSSKDDAVVLWVSSS